MSQDTNNSVTKESTQGESTKRMPSEKNLLDMVKQNITPHVYVSMQRAIELGKWKNGQKLSKEQKQNCIQMLIAYDELHMPEQSRIGYIHPKTHTGCGTTDDTDWKAIRFDQD